MNALISFVSPSTMHTLGWTLLHFLWQGTALAAVAAAAMAVCRRPSVRYIFGVGVLALMLLAPLVTLFVISVGHSGTADAAKSLPLVAAARPIATGREPMSGPTSAMNLSKSLPRFIEGWLVEAWLLGVAFFGLRSAGGFFLLERERRKQSRIVE